MITIFTKHDNQIWNQHNMWHLLINISQNHPKFADSLYKHKTQTYSPLMILFDTF